MNKRLREYADKINALSIRERFISIVTTVVLLVFIWWNFYAEPLQLEANTLNQRNQTLDSELLVMNAMIQSIQQRIRQGVHKVRQQRLQALEVELDRTNSLLNQKTHELIEPDQMFELMQQLIFSESKLKLTGLKRKQLKPAFADEQKDGDQSENNRPRIYRHIMQMRFEGKYRDVLNYIAGMEDLEWKLIWDKITLTIAEYPVIAVDIEISTLSESRQWVGL